MKREVDGRIKFEEDEEEILALLHRANSHVLKGGVSYSVIEKASGLDTARIDDAVSELIKNYVITSNGKTGTVHLTPYGKICAAYVVEKPKQAEKQARFLSELHARSHIENKLAPGSAVDRYIIGRSVGCNTIEVDEICAELRDQNLIEDELKEVKIFQGTDLERVREVPTKKVRITPAGIVSILKRTQKTPDSTLDLLKAQQPEEPQIPPVETLADSSPAEETTVTSKTKTKSVEEEISNIIQSIVLGALAIGLTILIVFYK